MKINYSLLLLFVVSIAIFSFTSNPPNGRTGAPGESTCAGCHTPPGSTNLNGFMDITGLPNTVIAGNTYTVTVAVNNPALNAVRAGFQMVAIDESNSNTGTLSNPSSSSTITNSGGKDYHEHAPAVSFNGNAAVNWTVDWTAPAIGTYADGDSLFLYGSSIIGNGGGSANDLTRLTSLRVDIENPPAPPVSIAVSNILNASCHDSSDGEATAVISGGTEPFDITWDNGEMGMTATMLSPGMHSVSVTDALNEMDQVTFEITAPDAIEVSDEIVTPTSCYYNCDGSIDFNISGGTAPYSITLDGMATTIPMTGLCPGTYTVIITDSNNCTLEKTYEILPPAVIEIMNATIINASCNGGSDGSIFIIPIGGTGMLITSWSNGESGNSITNLSAGDYTATIIDDNNCTYQETFTVGEANPLEVTIVENESIPCFGLFGTLAVSEVYESYNWSNGIQTALNEGIPSGTYTVTVVDANGCEGIGTYELDQPDSLILNFDITHVVMGADGEISVIPTGGNAPYTYNWNTGDSDSTIIKLDAGLYTVTVTDANNCEAIGSVEVTDNCTLEFTSTDSTPVSCSGGSDGSVSFTYGGTIIDSLEIIWSTGDTDTLLMLDNLMAGTYSVTISDGGACMVDTTIVVTEPSPIHIDFEVITFPSSETSTDGSITAMASGGTGSNYVYEWNVGTGDTLNNIGTGKYILWVVDENGCSVKDSLELTVAVCDYEINLNHTELLCPGDSTGEANYNVIGGIDVVTTWSTGETGDTISDLTTGNYYLSAIDSLGCIDTLFFTIQEASTELDILDTIYSPINCEDTLASIQILLGDLNGPFSYLWSNGDTSNIADSLLAGSYMLTITNANGCENILTLETQENFSDEITYDITEVSIYLDENGNAPAYMEGISNLMGNCEDSLYVIYPMNTFDCSDIGPGEDTVEIYNFDEFVDIEIVPYTVYDTIPPVYNCPIDTAFTGVGITNCGPGVLFYNIVIPGDSIKDNCTVFNDTTITAIFNIDTTGTYVFSYDLIDECGNSTSCTVSREFEVFDGPTIEYEQTNASCFGASDGCIEIDIIDGIPPFFIIPENICELSAGTYEIEVIDSSGCSVIFDATITQPEEIMIVETDKGGETDGQSDGFIDVTVTGGSGPYTFEWTENGEVVSNLEDLINFPSSQYVLTVTDSLGCTQILSTFIDVADNIDNEAFAQIKIYPNPFDNRVIIEGASDSDATIELLNILGQKIDVVILDRANQHVIMTNDLTDGIYLVKINLNDQVKTYKIIK